MCSAESWMHLDDFNAGQKFALFKACCHVPHSYRMLQQNQENGRWFCHVLQLDLGRLATSLFVAECRRTDGNCEGLADKGFACAPLSQESAELKVSSSALGTLCYK